MPAARWSSRSALSVSWGSSPHRGRVRDGEGRQVLPGAQKTVQAFVAWQRMHDKLVVGKVTEDECELWKARFTY